MTDKKLDRIYSNFDESINWNAYLYIFQKIITTILTFIFFKQLTAYDFSIWTNINSIVFLILLWLDFGFRKSVPKYIIDFEKSKKSHLAFTKFIIKFQLTLLFVVITILSLSMSYITFWLGINLSKDIFIFAFLLLILETPIALLRLIYHSHFWNKYFNLFYSYFILTEGTILITLLYKNSLSLKYIFLTKIIINSFFIIFAGYHLIRLYLKKEYEFDQNQEDNVDALKKNFLQHSFLMWVNSILRSLGERNFLIPLITYSIGYEFTNIFKIANDWALIFQRTITKTIGTTDTSLLSYIKSMQNNFIQNAFTKIIAKIGRLCLPLFGIFIFIIINKHYFLNQDQMIFPLFILLISLYFIESVLSPYERLLEINNNYLALIICYLPYLFFGFLFISNLFVKFGSFSLLIFILSLTKLINILSITVYCRKKYGIKFRIE